jgi:hypothetical protein
MTPDAALLTDKRKNWFSSLGDCFRVSGTGAERPVKAKSKVSFRLFTGFHAVPVNVGYGSVADRAKSNFTFEMVFNKRSFS